MLQCSTGVWSSTEELISYAPVLADSFVLQLVDRTADV